MKIYVCFTFLQGQTNNEIETNLRGIVLGNAIISPAQVLSKLGCYLEEWAYVDAVGRAAVEELSQNTINLVNDEKYAEAFSNLLNLTEFVNDKGGAVAVNLHHIIEKLTKSSVKGVYLF